MAYTQYTVYKDTFEDDFKDFLKDNDYYFEASEDRSTIVVLVKDSTNEVKAKYEELNKAWQEQKEKSEEEFIQDLIEACKDVFFEYERLDDLEFHLETYRDINDEIEVYYINNFLYSDNPYEAFDEYTYDIDMNSWHYYSEVISDKAYEIVDYLVNTKGYSIEHDDLYDRVINNVEIHVSQDWDSFLNDKFDVFFEISFPNLSLSTTNYLNRRIAGISDEDIKESNLYTIASLQGYTIEDLKDAIIKNNFNGSEFLETLVEASYDFDFFDDHIINTYFMVAIKDMKLKEMLGVMSGTHTLELPAGTLLGIYDEDGDALGLEDVTLEQPLTLTNKEITYLYVFNDGRYPESEVFEPDYNSRNTSIIVKEIKK